MLTCYSFVQDTFISRTRTLTRRAGRGVELRANAVQEIIRNSGPLRFAIPTNRRNSIGVVRQFALDALKLRGDRGLLALDSLRDSLVGVGCEVNGIIADFFHKVRMILLTGGMRGSALTTADEGHQISFSADNSMEDLPILRHGAS